MQKSKPDVYVLVESLKAEINKTGKVSPLNPAYKYFLRAVKKSKVRLKKDSIIYRARIMMGRKAENDDKKKQDDFDNPFAARTLYDDNEVLEVGEDGELILKSGKENTEQEKSKPDTESNAKKSVKNKKTDETQPSEEVIPEADARTVTEEELKKEKENTAAGEEKVDAEKMRAEHDTTVIDEDKPKTGLSKCVFASGEPMGAIADYRSLNLTECIVDELIITKTKKLADFTEVTGTAADAVTEMNRYLALYFSLYMRDVNSNFFKPARYIMEYLMGKKFDGIAYRNNFNRKINYVLFSPYYIMLGASKSVQIEPAPRLDD